MSTREQLCQWSEEMTSFHMPRWEELPTFELYIDQVITLIESYLSPLFGPGETIITSAMCLTGMTLYLSVSAIPIQPA